MTSNQLSIIDLVEQLQIAMIYKVVFDNQKKF